MHSGPDRVSRARAQGDPTRRCGRTHFYAADLGRPETRNAIRKEIAARFAGGSHEEPKDSARAIAHFYRATRPFAASGDDARRSVIDFGKTFEAAACSANDAFAASVPNRRPQFLAGVKRAATNFPTPVCKFGGC